MLKDRPSLRALIIILSIVGGIIWLTFPSNNEVEIKQAQAPVAADPGVIRQEFPGPPARGAADNHHDQESVADHRIHGDQVNRENAEDKDHVHESVADHRVHGDQVNRENAEGANGTDNDRDQESVADHRVHGDQVNRKNAEGQLRYTADWASLDSRPLPRWYHEAKFGIFIHWGVFSVPSFSSEWFWDIWINGHKQSKKITEEIRHFMKQNFKPNVSYVDFAPQFTAEFFNASQWAEILASSGARYVVLTSKHHEGFTLWPSKYASRWNAVDVGPRRDVLGELTKAVRTKTNMRMGFYYSLYEWFHPLYLQDRNNNHSTYEYVDTVMMPELEELVKVYRPDVVWVDGEWEANSSYWKSKEFLAWLFNDSPVKDDVVTNDRWGKDCRCQHGSFLSCNDGYDPGATLQHKWENCSTVHRLSWGFVRKTHLDQYLSAHDIIHILVKTVSFNGNLLLNIGATHDGLIPPIYAERLRQVGEWLAVNGEAIYGTDAWRVPQDFVNRNVRYTTKTDKEGRAVVYAVFLQWPESNVLEISAPTFSKDTTVHMLGRPQQSLKWKRRIDHKRIVGASITLPLLNPLQLPSKWAWVLKLSHVTY